MPTRADYFIPTLPRDILGSQRRAQQTMVPPAGNPETEGDYRQTLIPTYSAKFDHPYMLTAGLGAAVPQHSLRSLGFAGKDQQRATHPSSHAGKLKGCGRCDSPGRTWEGSSNIGPGQVSRSCQCGPGIWAPPTETYVCHLNNGCLFLFHGSTCCVMFIV